MSLFNRRAILGVVCWSLTACQGGKPSLLTDPPAPQAGYQTLTDAGDDTITSIIGIDAGCVSATIRGQLRPSNLLFIVDRSGSMNCNLPEDGQSSSDCDKFPVRRFSERPSKWELTLDALQSTLVTLAKTDRVRVAFSAFPVSESPCTVAAAPTLPFARLETDRAQEIASVIKPLVPYGNTPLVGATVLGYQYLLEEMRKGTLDGESFIVLVSDGRETCRPDLIDKLLKVDAPTALERLGVRTFVIGVPGSEDAREFLSSLAEAGGTVRSTDCHYGPSPSDGNCHFDMTTSTNFSRDLVDSLTRINAEALSCAFSIPEATGGVPVDLTRVNVSLNGESIQFLASQSCNAETSGWQYTPGNASIRLCGTACAKAQQPGSDVSIVLGCPHSVW